MKKKVIVFGDPAFSIKDNMQTPDIKIRRFSFNPDTMEIDIVYEKGLSVNHVSISIFMATQEGLVNLNVLNAIIK